MSDLIIAAIVVCTILLPASIVTHRSATAPPEEPHDSTGCRHCARLFSACVPVRRRGGEL
ncbi:hypothetical protein [Streptomyces sp. NPDC092952]|uniref:hypothetical protein n=1 Tax=Streptomyces sp. NPDC092952 TaxID=3366018 RepID=UPI00380F3F96